MGRADVYSQPEAPDPVLIRALGHDPAVLLLDVDGAGDAAFRTAVRERVLPRGTAVLTIAHRLATAGRFADLAALEAAGWDWQHDQAP